MTQEEYIDSKIKTMTDLSGKKSKVLMLKNETEIKDFKKQLALCNVSCSLPSKEEIHIEAEKYQDEQLNDPLALTYDAFTEGCNYVIKKQKQKSD